MADDTRHNPEHEPQPDTVARDAGEAAWDRYARRENPEHAPTEPLASDADQAKGRAAGDDPSDSG